MAAAAVIRGPYLQQGATNSVVVRWRTDLPTDSVVRYGVSVENLPGLASDSGLNTEHILKLSGLDTDTRYYYQLGTSSGWFQMDTNDFFFTSPPVGIPKSVRIWAIGDAGTATAEQAAVRNAYSAYNGAHRTDLFLMLGDNAYDTGLDIEYQAAVFNMYPTVVSCVLYAAAKPNVGLIRTDPLIVALGISVVPAFQVTP